MKKIFLSFATAIIFTSCGTGLESKKSGLSEQELIIGFEGVRLKFKNVFENPEDFNQESLKPLNDSLAYYAEAMVNEFPNSKELPELLCRAGISSLNVKNAKMALEYLKKYEIVISGNKLNVNPPKLLKVQEQKFLDWE